MSKLAIALFASIATASALAQNLQCPDITKTLKEYSIDSSSGSFLNSVFNQHCQQDGSRKSTGTLVGLDTIIKAIPINLTGKYNNSAEAFTNFCSTYASSTATTSNSDSYKETISAKALDTIAQCQRLQASNVIITHEVSSAESLAFYLRNSVTQKFEIQGIQTTGPVKCTGQISGVKTNFDMSLNARITKTQSFGCVRSGTPTPDKTGTDYPESIVTVLTNQGNYSVFWPKDQREILASAIDRRITTLESNLNKINAATSQGVYKCPAGTDGWNPGGTWGSYGCQGQISTLNTCTNIEYPHNQVRLCEPIGSIRLYAQ